MPMTHSKEIQAALNYIEINLCEELPLDEIANAVGFSKFYFHRTFQSEIGNSPVRHPFCFSQIHLYSILPWPSALNLRKLLRELSKASINCRRADTERPLKA